jgi:mannose-6-phosphate isomerase
VRRINGTVQNYAWGSPTAIPGLLGIPVTGEPYAEYWLGAHPSAPSTVAGVPLDSLLNAEPDLLGPASLSKYGSYLPYLMKVLAADHPLSLQAHPDRTQAEAGFAREEAEGIPLTAFERTYRDNWPKPETLIALTEFHGLYGFRDPARTAELFVRLGVDVDSVMGPLVQRRGSAALAEVFLDVLSLDGDRADVVTEVLVACRAHIGDGGELGEFARTALELDRSFPGDKGILAAMLMNRFTLQPGEGIYLPPGNMHAYLRGVGVEVMANSDNVLRGGLTQKHIDVEQLLTVVDFRATDVPVMATTDLGQGVRRYEAGAKEFAVWSMATTSTPAAVPGRGARIVLVVAGNAMAVTATDEIPLRMGAAILVGDDEVVTLAGDGLAYVAGPGCTRD